MWIVTASHFNTMGGAIGVVYPTSMTRKQVKKAAAEIPHIPKNATIEIKYVDCPT